MTLPDLRAVPVAQLFPETFAADPVREGWTRGGHARALELLDQIQPQQYGRDRSYLDGHITRLSAFLRYGVLTLGEVRDAALARVSPTAPSQAWKLVNELSWRDFFVRVYAEVGAQVWDDFQPYKTGLRAADYARGFAHGVPDDIHSGTTGLVCIDAWSDELRTTGFLHNHVRMWLAAYVIHHRRVWWQGGAAWFLHHLLDGDPAANNLNWQWVASTWRSYPYIWNRETLTRYAGQRYCAPCPLRDAGCPFAGTYAELSARLFPGKKAPEGETGAVSPQALRSVPWEPLPTPQRADAALVWVHEDRLSPTGEALAAYPQAPALFVWDEERLREDSGAWEHGLGPSAARLSFIHDCVAELPVRAVQGESAALLVAAAQAAGVKVIATTPSPSPHFARTVQALRAAGLEVQLWSLPTFAESLTPLDLRSHSAYWGQVSASAFGKPPALPKPKTKRARRAATAQKKA